MSEITYRQLCYIVDLGLKSEEEAKKLTKEEANRLLAQEVPRFYARKLVEWGIKSEKETASMFPEELKKLYNLHRQSRKLNSLRKGLEEYEVGNEVWNKQIVGEKEVKVSCVIISIRKPEPKEGYFKNLSNNITVEFSDGSHRALDLSRIEKKKK